MLVENGAETRGSRQAERRALKERRRQARAALEQRLSDVLMANERLVDALVAKGRSEPPEYVDEPQPDTRGMSEKTARRVRERYHELQTRLAIAFYEAQNAELETYLNGADVRARRYTDQTQVNPEDIGGSP